MKEKIQIKDQAQTLKAVRLYNNIDISAFLAFLTSGGFSFGLKQWDKLI